MGEKRIFDIDRETGVITYFESTDEGFNLYTVQDVQPTLDLNRELRSDKSYWRAGGDMRFVASVPEIVWLKWAMEDGVPASFVFSQEYMKRVAAKLESSDWKNLKTADVRI